MLQGLNLSCVYGNTQIGADVGTVFWGGSEMIEPEEARAT